jgi:hypothetical protein
VASLVIAGPYVLRVQPHGLLIDPYKWVLLATLIVGMIVALPAVAGMWSMLYIVRDLDQELSEHGQSSWSPGTGGSSRRSRTSGRRCGGFLICAAAEISGVILAASALHNALAAKDAASELRAEYVVLYGSRSGSL